MSTSTNTPNEVMFLRLLSKCNQIVEGEAGEREDLINWQRSPVFHHYVDTLQEQLADLEDSGNIKAVIFDQYRQKVKSIASQLQKPDLPSYCLPTTANANPQQLLRTQMPSIPLAPPLKSQKQQQQQQQKSFSSTTTKDKEYSTKPTESPESLQLSDKAKASLISEHAVQDNIAEELLGLTAALKTNTLAMEGKLKERGELLDSTEEALDKSVAGAKSSAAKATALRKRGRLNLCLTCLVMLIIGASFVGMFMFIRVTRFAGYSSKRAAAVGKTKSGGGGAGGGMEDAGGGHVTTHTAEQPISTNVDDDTYYYYYTDNEFDKQEL